MEPAASMATATASATRPTPPKGPPPSTKTAELPKHVLEVCEKIKELTPKVAATFQAGKKKEASDLAVELGNLYTAMGTPGAIQTAWKSYSTAVAWNPDNQLAISKLNESAQTLKKLGVGTYVGVKPIPAATK